MPGEFELIETYFTALQRLAPGVVLGIGDDAALLEVDAGHQLVVATDTLVAGVHFPDDLPAQHIASRSLLVNLSDLAAMGAEPRWFSLALTLPQADEAWLAAFSEGLASAATAHRCALIGGDTTRGPLTITVTVHGVVPREQALTRSGAKVGDRIWVTGEPGLGAAGLAAVQGKLSALPESQLQIALDKFHAPKPRLAFAQAVRDLASAAIDISDGLYADLGHICECSNVAAELWLDRLPPLAGFAPVVNPDIRRQWSLCGGDDYELCLAVPADNEPAFQAAAAATDTPVTEVGQVLSGNEISLFEDSLSKVSAHIDGIKGYQHF